MSLKTLWSGLTLAGVLLAGLLASGHPVCAQIRSSTITGILHDASGAVVAGGDVALTDTDTNITVHSTTTDAGQFTFPYLQNGTYEVLVKVPGFTPYRETGIRVETNQTVRIDVALKVGSVESAMEVQAQAVQLETDSSTVQDSQQAEAISSLPNITRNPLYYAELEAGVVPRGVSSLTMQTSWMNSFGIGFYGRMNWSAMGINGGRAFTNDIQLDGLAVMSSGYNEVSVVPNTEALQEVRVISNNFTAEYGRGQGVISMITKSGTNAYHGELNYHLRNDLLNANSNYNNTWGFQKPPFKLNDFGGAIGGPIKKNKLFFFTSYHYMRFNQGIPWLETVPTALERVGNFSQTKIADYSGLPVAAQIFDPFNVTKLGPNLYQRTPYPNAIIPNPNPYAEHIYSLYPLPNRAPSDDFGDNNFGTTTAKTYRKDDNNTRVDYKAGAHSIYASGGIGYGNILTASPWGANSLYSPGGDRQTRDFNPYAQIGDIVILSPSLVLDVRYGANRINMIEEGGSTSGFSDYNGWGVPSNIQAIMPDYGGTPDVLPGGNWTPLNNATNNNKHEWQFNQVLSASLTKSRGKWTHKFGGEFRDMVAVWQDYYQLSTDISASNFTSEYVTANGTNASQNTTAPQQGITPASLLAGAGSWDVNPGRNVRPVLSARYLALYSQNDWRATSRLTLNLGLRWDLQPGPTERHNRMSAFDLSEQNAFGSLGTIVFPGVNGYGSSIWNTEYHDFGPRVGAAYRLSDSLVMRGGFGISYLPSNTGNYSSQLLYNETPFTAYTNAQPFGTNPQGVPVGQFSDPNVVQIVPPVGANASSPYAYSPGSAFINHEPNGRAMQWNITLEKRISSSWFASAAYVASYGSHLQTSWLSFENLQNLPASTLSGWRSQYIASNGTLDPSQELIPNPYQPASGPLLPFGGALGDQTIPQYIPLLPYPLLSQLWALQENLGASNYNALQLRLKHAFSNGLLLDAHYTWSKALDDTSTIAEDTQGINNGSDSGSWDLHNLHNNMKYSFSDLPNQFTFSAVYDLPFGTGRPLEIQNKVLRAVAGNWQASGVWIWQDGFPFGPSGLSDGAAYTQPNRIAGVPIQVPKSLQHWYNGSTSVTLPCGRVVTPPANTFLIYNLCAFDGDVVTTPNGSVVPDIYWYGDAAATYGDMRGPGRFNVDMSLKRTFRIRESMNFQFGVDATNLLNHTQYVSIPGPTIQNYLGNTNTVTNSSVGLAAGQGTNSAYGTMGPSSFDPREIVLNLRLLF